MTSLIDFMLVSEKKRSLILSESKAIYLPSTARWSMIMMTRKKEILKTWDAILTSRSTADCKTQRTLLPEQATSDEWSSGTNQCYTYICDWSQDEEVNEKDNSEKGIFC